MTCKLIHSRHASGYSMLIFCASRIIGLSDGLTVPFGLTAGLSSLGSSKLVVIAGLAEVGRRIISSFSYTGTSWQ